jgi:hypothetical protein
MTRARWRGLLHPLAALAIAAGAFDLRWRALEALPIDYDETWYLEGAQEIAEVLRSGELAGLTATNKRPEHPQLVKLLYAAAILRVEPSPPSPERRDVAGGASRLPESQLVAARGAAGAFGALEVLLLAWIHPLAGLLLALHAWTIKYTSLVMLEALPAFTSLASVASYARFKKTGGNAGWIASAILLGLSAAGKYMYAVVGVAILIDWALELRAGPPSRLARARPLLLWGAGSLLAFFAAYPYLWPDPLWRLEQSLFFHAAYSTSANVAGFPFWQPLVWLTTRAGGHDSPAYWVQLDPWLTLLALLGLDRLWREERVYALWLGVALLFLLLWNTKWPHYVLILTAPLCLAAAAGALRLLAVPVRALRARRSGA